MKIQRKRNFGTKQLLIVASVLLAACLLIVGTYSPDSILMSFADTSTMNMALRVTVIVSLLAVLFSRPPRSMPFRITLGAFSSLTLIGTFVLMTDYHIGVLDALLYLEASIILALEALEYDTSARHITGSVKFQTKAEAVQS